MASLTHKIARNAALQVAGKVIGTVLSLGTFVLLVHRLDTDGFGALSIALNYATILAVLVDFGLTLTTTQMISEPGADETKLMGNVLTLRVISAFLFLGIGAAAVFALPYAPEVQIAAVISCASFFFGTISSVFIGIFQKRLQLWYSVIAETMNRFVVFVCAFALLYTDPSIIAAAAIFVAGGIVQLIITLFAVDHHLTIRPQLSLHVWKEILVRSWPIGLSIAFNLVYLRGDVFFMSLFGVSDHDIGLYSSAYKVVDVTTTVPVMLMGLMLPLLTHSWVGNERKKFSEHFQRAFDVVSLLGVPFAFGAIATGGALLSLIKADLAAAGPVLAILGPATTMVFFGSLFGHTVVALNRQRQMIWSYIGVACVSVAGYAAFIPKYGIEAAAWVTLICEFLIAAIAAIVVMRVARPTFTLRTLMQSLGASLVMFALLLFVPFPHVLVAIGVGVAVYGIALPLFGGPSPKRILSYFMNPRT